MLLCDIIRARRVMGMRSWWVFLLGVCVYGFTTFVFERREGGDDVRARYCLIYFIDWH